MAVLSPIYWQAITPAMREVLRFISYPLLAPTSSVEGVALAGIVDIGLKKQVKQFFFDQARALGRTWFEDQEE